MRAKADSHGVISSIRSTTSKDSPAGASPAAPVRDRPARSAGRVPVDDGYHQHRRISDGTLEIRGFEVETAGDGEAALHKLEAGLKPDLIITEINCVRRQWATRLPLQTASGHSGIGTD